MRRNTIIAATGSYIPEQVVPNSHFFKNEFFVPGDKEGEYVRDPKPITERVQKLEEITGIKERRYVRDDQVASDIGAEALKNTGYDLSGLDYLICATNFGDIDSKCYGVNIVPSVSAKIKNKAGITNPKTIAYDIAFGCPGWLEGVIQAHQFIQGGFANRIAVVGAETLSRVCDPHDMDRMIYSDGAGAVILEARESRNDREIEGIVSFSHRSDSENAHFLNMGPSYNPDYPDKKRLFLKMCGPKLFVYAQRKVPEVLKESLDTAGKTLGDLNMILIHQANERLDNAILAKAGLSDEEIKRLVPMTISWLGNSSVATLPTLLDLVTRGKMNGYNLKEGNLIAFASVGAGMNRNAVVYKMPA